MIRALALLLALGVASPAAALSPSQRPVVLSTSLRPYIGPGDIAPFTAWYSCARAYSRAFATTRGAMCNLRNSATAETCDVLAGPRSGKPSIMSGCSGSSNGQTLASFCAASGGPCTVTKAYDQTGGGRDILQATAANQPGLTVSCLGGLPCIVLTSATTSLASSATFTPATGVLTDMAVANRAVFAAVPASLMSPDSATANALRVVATASQWRIGSGALIAPTSDAAWHVGVGTVNGASAFLAIDGTSTTGTATGGTTAGPIAVIGGAGATVDETEAGFKDATAMSAGTATSLCQNAQTAYGGGGNFAATC